LLSNIIRDTESKRARANLLGREGPLENIRFIIVCLKAT
jgi:hypothetical protein